MVGGVAFKRNNNHPNNKVQCGIASWLFFVGLASKCFFVVLGQSLRQEIPFCTVVNKRALSSMVDLTTCSTIYLWPESSWIYCHPRLSYNQPPSTKLNWNRCLFFKKIVDSAPFNVVMLRAIWENKFRHLRFSTLEGAPETITNKFKNVFFSI